MDDAGCVRLSKCVGHRDRAIQSVGQPHSLAGDQAIERLARDKLHHDEVDAVGRTNVINRDDIRVVQRRGGLGFLNEAPFTLRIGDFIGRQNLDRDESAEACVAGLVDHPHPAFSQFFQDFVVR